MKEIWTVSVLCCITWAHTDAQLTAILVNNSASTEKPTNPLVTGKLNQFKGFHTLRPFPPNANFMYASVWASWSAWSFCAGKVQVRVRACNTVRGYSCLGPNKETKPCDVSLLRPDEDERQKPNADYNVHDPWDTDRREAMKQLYTDYDTVSEAKQKTSNPEFRRQLSAGRTLVRSSDVRNPSGPPMKLSSASILEGEGAHAPSMTPELLYERKSVVNSTASKDSIRLASKTGKKGHHDNEINAPLSGATARPEATSTTKQSYVVDRDAKLKPLSNKLRNNQTSLSDVRTDKDPHKNKSSSNPVSQQSHLINNQSSTKPLQNSITNQQQSTSAAANDFVSKTIEEPLQKPLADQGDGVQITSNVQQHFKHVASPLSKELSLSISSLNSRDPKLSRNPLSIQSQISEESLAKALEASRSGKSSLVQESLKIQKSTKSKSTLVDNAQPSIVAQKPTTEEVERMAKEFDKTQLNSETEQKFNLHSGEINYSKLTPMNDETIKALEWMLKNMTQAMQAHKPPSLDKESATSGSRVFASKRLNNSQLSKSLILQEEVPMQNLDKEEQDLELEMTVLKENMKQMKTQLEELRKAEINAQQPVFNVSKAKNLNLVPNGSRDLPLSQKASNPLEKPSEFFLLEQFQRSSVAHWSDWGPYGDCFCNKRIRTRNCIYDNPVNSEGCEGKSYESIRCISERPCPNRRKSLLINRRTANISQDRPSTSVGQLYSSTKPYYTAASARPTTEKPPQGNFFYPNPLPIIRRQL